MRAPASLAALFAALCAASAARANPIDAFGFGARAAGLASAGTAVADDASANYYNPGALAFASSLRLDLGYRYASPHLRLDGKDQPADAAHGSQMAATARALDLERSHLYKKARALGLRNSEKSEDDEACVK